MVTKLLYLQTSTNTCEYNMLTQLAFILYSHVFVEVCKYSSLVTMYKAPVIKHVLL